MSTSKIRSLLLAVVAAVLLAGCYPVAVATLRRGFDASDHRSQQAAIPATAEHYAPAAAAATPVQPARAAAGAPADASSDMVGRVLWVNFVTAAPASTYALGEAGLRGQVLDNPAVGRVAHDGGSMAVTVLRRAAVDGRWVVRGQKAIGPDQDGGWLQLDGEVDARDIGLDASVPSSHVQQPALSYRGPGAAPPELAELARFFRAGAVRR